MLNFATWKIYTIAAVLLVGAALASPNVLPKDLAEKLPSWAPHNQVNLGLDLRGGLYLLMQVDVESVVRERTETIVEGIRSELRKANIQYRNIGQRGLGATVTINKPEDVERARDIVSKIEANTTTTVTNDRIDVIFSERALKDLKSNIVGQSIEIVRHRIDETGTKEPSIQRQGEDRILLQLPGVDDPERVKKLLNTTAKMTFHLMCDQQSDGTSSVPPGCMAVPQSEATAQRQGGTLPTYLLRRKVEVSGDRLVDSQPGFDQRTSQPIVNFRFDRQGAKQFGDITVANVNKPFAIVLDNKVISAPVIREPILGGQGQISGGFTVKDAQDLSLLLRAGALPAPVKFIEERSVGPGLGADSIKAGVYAIIVAFALVIVYMIGAYGLFGIFADVAVVANLMLLVGAMSALQATLTLPGIAGILLTLGMSVDANVLINERIREETKSGKTPIAAIEAGFSRAFSTILDANLTTLIKMLLLYFYGTGPVKGFAVTISIGIITSMFTALLLVRFMIMLWVQRARPRLLPV
jgi:preprotein translocase subunit SecD